MDSTTEAMTTASNASVNGSNVTEEVDAKPIILRPLVGCFESWWLV